MRRAMSMQSRSSVRRSMRCLAGLLQQTDRDEEAFEHLHHDLREQRQSIALVRFERRRTDFVVGTVDQPCA